MDVDRRARAVHGGARRCGEPGKWEKRGAGGSDSGGKGYPAQPKSALNFRTLPAGGQRVGDYGVDGVTCLRGIG
jgi:hypothetical protein